MSCTSIQQYIRSIDSRGICLRNHRYRFKLIIETNSSGNKDIDAIIFLKNPSNTCVGNYNKKIYVDVKSGKFRDKKGKIMENIAIDRTIRKVIRLLHSYYSRIVIVNLYPIVDPDTKVVKDFLNKKHKIFSFINKCCIKHILLSAKKGRLFCAWGEKSKIPSGKYLSEVYYWFYWLKRKEIKMYEYDKNGKRHYKLLKPHFPRHALIW